MARRYKAVKVTKQGIVTDEENNPIICPIRSSGCNLKCAWFSIEDRVLRCQNTIIGAIRGKPVRSFHLSTGPTAYKPDEPPEIELDVD